MLDWGQVKLFFSDLHSDICPLKLTPPNGNGAVSSSGETCSNSKVTAFLNCNGRSRGGFVIKSKCVTQRLFRVSQDSKRGPSYKPLRTWKDKESHDSNFVTSAYFLHWLLCYYSPNNLIVYKEKRYVFCYSFIILCEKLYSGPDALMRRKIITKGMVI